ncbi:MAG: ABC transporter substrate-binding protein [Bacilli bacterium]
MKKLKLMLSVLLTATLIACGGGADDVAKASKPNYPMTITDQTGAKVKLNKKPARIVSIMPSTTEIAYALNLDKQVVGVTTNCNFPTAAKKVAKVGDFNINVEKVVALKPDVVFADAGNGEVIQKLRDLKIPVIVAKASTFEDVYKSIEMFGKATGKTGEATTVVKGMKTKVDKVKKYVKTLKPSQKKSAVIAIDPTLYVAAKGSFLDEMLRITGTKNVYGDEKTPWPQVSEESLIARNPDIYFHTYGYYVKDATQQVYDNAKYKNTNFVKNKKVIALDADTSSRPGPRLADALVNLTKKLYPNFK